MEIILIEKIERLGNVGDQVLVKNGFARNYLIPQNKALRSTPENKEYFEKKKEEIIAKNTKISEEAKKIFNKINNKSIIIICHASDEGRLYGSIIPKDIATKITENFKTEIKKSQIILSTAIREIGIIETKIRIHADYIASVKINIARSQEEAQSNIESNKKEKSKASLAETAKKLGTSDTTENQEINSDSTEKANKEAEHA